MKIPPKKRGSLLFTDIELAEYTRGFETLCLYTTTMRKGVEKEEERSSSQMCL